MTDPNAPQTAPGASEPGRPLLIRGGCVLSFDERTGDLDRGDVLIRNGVIEAVGPRIDAADAQEIDAKDMIVMPGFVDSHRHLWEGVIRNLLPDSTLLDYLVEVNGRLGPTYRADDVHIGTLVSALGALNAGVTTVLDWAHIQNSPDHTEASIAALKEAGIRAVFAHGPPSNGKGPWWLQSDHGHPDAVRTLHARHFNSDDQLLTLAVAASGPEIAPFEAAAREWRAARDVGARIAVHVGSGPMGQHGKLEEFGRTGLLGPDTTYIHCNGLNETEWSMIADTGGAVSISAPIEMQMGHGTPPVQAAVDNGLLPSLSVDVECNQPGDFFGQMRGIFGMQRVLVHEKTLRKQSAPSLVTAQDVVRWATLGGACANGLERKVGSLTVGKQADVILLRTNAINVMPMNNAYGAVVLGMDTSNVDTVIVAGRIVKSQGKLLGIDIGSIERAVGKAREHVLRTAGYSTSPTASTVCDRHSTASFQDRSGHVH